MSSYSRPYYSSRSGCLSTNDTRTTLENAASRPHGTRDAPPQRSQGRFPGSMLFLVWEPSACRLQQDCKATQALGLPSAGTVEDCQRHRLSIQVLPCTAHETYQTLTWLAPRLGNTLTPEPPSSHPQALLPGTPRQVLHKDLPQIAPGRIFS